MPPPVPRASALALLRRRPFSPRRPAPPRRRQSSSPPPRAAGASSPVRTSLALSVYFRAPELGMTEYEILSRATAFLLTVDPPGDGQGGAAGTGTAFPHLREHREERERARRRQEYGHAPAAGPSRLPHQLNWLEYCPVAFRPRVHVVASSHVLAPWRWPKYYGQDWLRVVTPEHVRYSLEAWGRSPPAADAADAGGALAHDGKLPGSYAPVAQFALNPYPIHHPEGMDVAVIHLKEEEEALKRLGKLGVRPLHLPTMHEFETSNDPVFEPGERVLFQGFEVYEANTIDQDDLTSEAKDPATQDDERMFHPYSSLGVLDRVSPDRFLAQTKAGPLPEGLCGGPAIQIPDETATGGDDAEDILTIRGVVEGIVPANHEDQALAGAASLLPSYRIREFVDFAERAMLEQIVDKDLFDRVVELKERREKKGTTYSEQEREGRASAGGRDEELSNVPELRASIEGTTEEEDTPHMDKEYRAIVASLRDNHTPEEVDAILATVEREGVEAAKILETDGGDVDEVIEAVRRKTYEEKDRIIAEIEEEMAGPRSGTAAEGDEKRT